MVRRCDVDTKNEMKGGDLMTNLQWSGQFGRLKTLLDRDDEGMVANDDDSDYLVQRNVSDLIGGGSKQPRKHQCNDSSYKLEEERNI